MTRAWAYLRALATLLRSPRDEVVRFAETQRRIRVLRRELRQGDPLMYVTHHHDVLKAWDSDEVLGTQGHAHSVSQRHPGNWTNANHDGVATETWVEHHARHTPRAADA